MAVEFGSHVAVGIATPLTLCRYVPPEENVKFELDDEIEPLVPVPLPSFFKVPVTVVKLFAALYIEPSPTADKINVPEIDIVRFVPEKDIPIDLVPVPVEP